MKVIFVAVIVLLSIAVIIFQNDEELKNFPPKNDVIVAFGDSLVEGYGASNGKDFVSQLELILGTKIVNLGKSGDTTADGVLRMKAVTDVDPGVVILLLGGNDTLRRVSAEVTEANLRTLIEEFQSAGAVVVLVGVRGGILSDAKADLYEALAKEYSTAYVPDVLKGIFLKPELMYDTIHPNERGYEIIARRISDLFYELELIRE